MQRQTEQIVWLLVPETRTLGTPEARMLLLRNEAAPPDGPENDLTLPRLTLPSGTWLPEGVATLSEQAEASLGVRTTVLRHLVDLDDSHICEAEVHEARWSPPAGSRWVTLAELRGLWGGAWTRRHCAAEAIERWFGEQSSATAVPPIRPSWEHRGWLDEILAWADHALTRAEAPRTGRPVPVKGAWSGSAILKLPTQAGDFYLKAGYGRPPGEAALLAALAERWPDAVPQVVALDAPRNVLLMRDFGGAELWGAPVARWENAARDFAQLQLECSQHLDRWLAMGLEDRRPATLPGHLNRLLADRTYLPADHPHALAAEEVTQLQAAAPQLKNLTDRLTESGVPVTLVQQDFRHGNLRVVPLAGAGARTHRFVFYDWANTVLSHPFFSGTRMLDYLGQAYETRPVGPGGVPGRVTYAPPAFRRFVRDAYLEPWTALSPASHLRQAFDLAWTLNPLWQAIRRWLELPYYERTSPWAVNSLARTPHLLRRVLRARL